MTDDEITDAVETLQASFDSRLADSSRRRCSDALCLLFAAARDARKALLEIDDLADGRADVQDTSDGGVAPNAWMQVQTLVREGL